MSLVCFNFGGSNVLRVLEVFYRFLSSNVFFFCVCVCVCVIVLFAEDLLRPSDDSTPGVNGTLLDAAKGKDFCAALAV